ncbi:MAG TPA: UDP-N-acetylglucosamine pyrophosphorylase [Planctomycetes bacterium]|nr:UDP-N-acetylglucosamine pyrophosphorylase [Planctomycetota bacterium]
MKSRLPKVLHRVLGLPMVEHVVRAAMAAGADRVVVVASPDNREQMVAALAHLPEVEVAVQEEPLGTAHAILAAKEALSGFAGTGLVLLGDAPCIAAASLEALLSEHAAQGAKLSVLSGTLDDPHSYGRIVRDEAGAFLRIVEEKNATPAEKAIQEINSGLFALELPLLWEVLEAVEPNATTGERYATDAVEISRARELTTLAISAANDTDVLGVNDRRMLAAVTAELRQRILEEHMDNGVTIVDPQSTFVDARATIEQDARLEPFTVIEGPCHIASGAVVGPFARLRAAKLGPEAIVGNFVEVVRSELGAKSRALHLSYLGDATLGEDVNVGAGTIFANFDGQEKHASTVAKGASLGSNTVVVGPASLGERARTGAGAVLVRGEVPAGETWVGVPARALQQEEAQ